MLRWSKGAAENSKYGTEFDFLRFPPEVKRNLAGAKILSLARLAGLDTPRRVLNGQIITVFYLALNKKVVKPEDFKGLKLGTATAARAAVQAWGASVVSLNMSEYYSSMEREFLTGIRAPARDEGTGQVFLKSRIRKSSDFALASVAVVARVSGGVCEDIRIVLGGVAPTPYVAHRSAELLTGRELHDELVLQAADAAVEKARPLRNNRYKVGLARTLVLRALRSLRSESAAA